MNDPTLAPSSHVDTFARDRLPPPAQWPVFVFDLPEVRYPAQINCAVELLDRHVREGRGERIALHGLMTGEGRPQPFSWTYAQLQGQVHRIAQVLTRDMGLVPGNRLLLRGGNSPMMAACFLAAIQRSEERRVGKD